MQNFNYLVGDPQTKECLYIDPAWEVDRLLKIAKEEGYRVTKILLTHNHFDHVEGVEKVVQKTGAEVFIHPLDAERVIPTKAGIPRDPCFRRDDNRRVGEWESSEIGKLVITCFHTPGHTPGSSCYLVSEKESPLTHLFTGDTLFQGNCGRSDLPGGDTQTLFQSLQILKDLDPSTKVYPGHDYGNRPATTIGYEKAHNPTLKASTFEEFDSIP